MDTGVTAHSKGAFDRIKSFEDQRDFRWIPDLEGEEFYGRQLSMDRKALGPVLHITSGEFYTRAKTAPLVRKKGNGLLEYFGSVAEEIAADIRLEGDAVLRVEGTGKEIVRLAKEPATSYEVVVENTPSTYQHVSNNMDHFQFYYWLFPEPKAERYGFKFATGAQSSIGPMLGTGYGLNLRGIVSGLGSGTPGMPDPYRCGAILLGKRETPLTRLQ